VMKFRTLFACTMAVGVGVGATAPSYSVAQTSYQHRQDTKNQWRNLAYAGGALGLLGLLSKNGTMTTLGILGAGYSAYRYEQDRKSQSGLAHARAQMFARSSFNYQGHHYVRKTFWRNGVKYYHFVRAY
jgi:hypothetical protein